MKLLILHSHGLIPVFQILAVRLVSVLALFVKSIPVLEAGSYELAAEPKSFASLAVIETLTLSLP